MSEGAARLVVDTNLFVAWVFRRSAPGPAGVLARWRAGKVRVCTSRAVLQEVMATLKRLPVAERRKRELLDLLEDPEATEFLEQIGDSGFRCADPNDDKFLHLALASDADALLTSDRALLEVEDFPVPIMKSGQWLRSRSR